MFVFFVLVFVLARWLFTLEGNYLTKLVHGLNNIIKKLDHYYNAVKEFSLAVSHHGKWLIFFMLYKNVNWGGNFFWSVVIFILFFKKNIYSTPACWICDGYTPRWLSFISYPTRARGKRCYLVNWCFVFTYCRSPLLGACNSHNKPLQRHFDRPLYF